jgi:hypothetical protein
MKKEGPLQLKPTEHSVSDEFSSESLIESRSSSMLWLAAALNGPAGE